MSEIFPCFSFSCNSSPDISPVETEKSVETQVSFRLSLNQETFKVHFSFIKSQTLNDIGTIQYVEERNKVYTQNGC